MGIAHKGINAATDVLLEVRMREKYESLSLAVLRDLAKARGLKKISALKKGELIERMLEEDEKETAAKQEPAQKETEKQPVRKGKRCV